MWKALLTTLFYDSAEIEIFLWTLSETNKLVCLGMTHMIAIANRQGKRLTLKLDPIPFLRFFTNWSRSPIVSKRLKIISNTAFKIQYQLQH